MKTTPEYLDAVRLKLGLTSDYQLAKYFEISRARISQYRTGKNKFDDLMCAKVAAILEISPLEVIAHINYERDTRPDARKVWQSIADSLRGVAAAVILSVLVLGGLAGNSTGYD